MESLTARLREEQSQNATLADRVATLEKEYAKLTDAVQLDQAVREQKPATSKIENPSSVLEIAAKVSRTADGKLLGHVLGHISPRKYEAYGRASYREMK